MIGDHLSAGILLVLAFVSFSIGATLPLVGEKGDSRFFGLGPRDYLQAIGRNPVAWRWPIS